MMREFINIINEHQQLDEKSGKFGTALAAAALMGAGAIGHKAMSSEPPNPQMIVQVDDDPYGAVDAKNPDGTISHGAKLSEPELLLALTMWGEARSDGVGAMRAVGHVVMNRLHSSRNFGSTIKQVVWKRKAFSCWNPSDPNRQAMQRIKDLPDTHPSKVKWKQAVTLAKKILSGRDADNTHGALFYHTKQIKPYWVNDEVKPIATVANHLFYKQDGKA